jgi:hypothetical protein
MLFKFNSEPKSSNNSNGRNTSNYSNCSDCSYSIDCQVSKSRANRQIEDDDCPFMDLESEEDDYESIDGDIYWLDMSDYRYSDTLWDYVEDGDYDDLDGEENWWDDDFGLEFMSYQEEEFYRFKNYFFKYMVPKNQSEVKGDIENE